MSQILTTCGFCSCGCGLYVQPRNGNVAGVCPSINHPVSSGRLCINGWNATPDVIRHGTLGRLMSPLIRKGDRLEAVPWDEAISFAASSIKGLISDFGPQCIGIIGSARTTNEECYSLVKLARSVIGTPNLDSSCRFYDASIVRALLETTGTPAAQLDIGSVVQARTMLIIGSNVMEQLPHIGSRIQEAVENGCRLVVADPRTSRLAPHASLFLHPRPGTDLVWLRALVRMIIDRQLYTEDAPRTLGFEELRTSLADVVTLRAEITSGIDADMINQAAEILSASPPVVMFGLGVLQQRDSSLIVKALTDIARLLGGAVMPLRGQNNAQGTCDMGLAHDFLPGYARLTDPVSKKAWESVWRCSLPSEQGMSAVDMVRACGSGKIKGLTVFGENVALAAPNTEETLAALDKVDFLAVSDLYLTETARLADVVFPACSFLEKDGTFTSIERRVQRVRKVLDPVGDSRSDLDIIADLATALGGKMPRDPADVMDEISTNVSQYAGISYDALDKPWGQQWPLTSSMEKLVALPASDVEENGDYPFRLIASRINFHQQTGTMARRSPILAREYPEPYAELNESDAGRLGLKPGVAIKISSQWGTVTRKMLLSDTLPRGCVHVPHFFDGDSPNALSSYECDESSGVPAYKSCAVKVEAAR